MRLESEIQRGKEGTMLPHKMHTAFLIISCESCGLSCGLGPVSEISIWWFRFELGRVAV